MKNKKKVCRELLSKYAFVTKWYRLNDSAVPISYENPSDDFKRWCRPRISLKFLASMKRENFAFNQAGVDFNKIFLITARPLVTQCYWLWQADPIAEMESQSLLFWGIEFKAWRFLRNE